MTQASVFQRYFLPGFVFQSVVIAGGYGTGRELVEFFLSNGPLGGLLGMVLVSTVIWSLVCAATFEFGRRFHAMDYRTFFKRLLGRGWLLFEFSYLFTLLIVLAVIAAAAGSILTELLGWPYLVGVLSMMAAVGLLVFAGSGLIERFLAGWSFLLYAVYIIFCAWAFVRFGDAIGAALGSGEVRSGWVLGGIKYAAYNLGVIPAVLFTIRHHRNSRESVIAGLLAGPIAIIPGVLFFLAMTGQYPAILNEVVPANYLLGTLGSRTFQVIFQLVLFGTLIETGTGMIHAVNERIAAVYHERDRTMPGTLRAAVAVGLLIAGALLAQFGLINLIAKGYGTVTWLFLFVFVIPILAWGALALVRRSNAPPSAAELV